MTRWGKKYYITLVNDSSRFAKVYMLYRKDEAIDKFLICKAKVSWTKKIKRVSYGREWEYDTTSFKKCSKEQEIMHELTTPYIPQ